MSTFMDTSQTKILYWEIFESLQVIWIEFKFLEKMLALEFPFFL